MMRQCDLGCHGLGGVGGRTGALKLNPESQNRQRVRELTSGDDHNGVSEGCTHHPHPPRCHTKPVFQDPESAQSLHSADQKGLSDRSQRTKVGFPGRVSQGTVVLRLLQASERTWLGSRVHTLYSGSRRSNAQAKASSQWKVPLCVPIRGGAMRLLRGLLGGRSGSEPSIQCWTWRTDRSGNSVKTPRRNPLPIRFPPQEDRPEEEVSGTASLPPATCPHGNKQNRSSNLVQAFLQLLKPLVGTYKRQCG